MLPRPPLVMRMSASEALRAAGRKGRGAGVDGVDLLVKAAACGTHPMTEEQTLWREAIAADANAMLTGVPPNYSRARTWAAIAIERKY